MGPDRNTHIRNFAIVIVLAVAVFLGVANGRDDAGDGKHAKGQG